MRATFPNPKDELINGDFGKIIIYSNGKDDMPIVPLNAVMENQESKYVITLDENNLPKLTYIKMSGQDGDFALITEGLAVGDTIVTTGIQKVIPGQPVKIVQTQVENQESTQVSNKKSLVSKIKNKLSKLLKRGRNNG